MKKIKDRPNTPLLQAQVLIQQERIKDSGMRAFTAYYWSSGSIWSTFYSPTIRSKYFNQN